MLMQLKSHLTNSITNTRWTIIMSIYFILSRLDNAIRRWIRRSPYAAIFNRQRGCFLGCWRDVQCTGRSTQSFDCARLTCECAHDQDGHSVLSLSRYVSNQHLFWKCIYHAIKYFITWSGFISFRNYKKGPRCNICVYCTRTIFWLHFRNQIFMI